MFLNKEITNIIFVICEFRECRFGIWNANIAVEAGEDGYEAGICWIIWPRGVGSLERRPLLHTKPTDYLNTLACLSTATNLTWFIDRMAPWLNDFSPLCLLYLSSFMYLWSCPKGPLQFDIKNTFTIWKRVLESESLRKAQ